MFRRVGLAPCEVRRSYHLEVAMTELSTYKLESLREDPEFVFYRGRRDAAPCSILVMAPSSKQPAPETLRRIEHEYKLRTELEPAWATQPLALVRYEGQKVLVVNCINQSNNVSFAAGLRLPWSIRRVPHSDSNLPQKLRWLRSACGRW